MPVTSSSMDRPVWTSPLRRTRAIVSIPLDNELMGTMVTGKGADSDSGFVFLACIICSSRSEGDQKTEQIRCGRAPSGIRMVKRVAVAGGILMEWNMIQAARVVT